MTHQNTTASPRIGVISSGSAVPTVELEMGVDRLRGAGFDVRVHPQCGEQHFTFAGTDRRRAEAIYEYATDDAIDVLWSARGGCGTTRLLPLLDALTAERGRPPPKLLVGYSDLTALHEYVRTRWDWATLHATMPAAAEFTRLSDNEWQATIGLVRGQPTPTPWGDHTLQFLGRAPAQTIRGVTVGGNIAVWQYLMGTPYAPPTTTGRFIFFEDCGEQYYRIDGMVTQIEQAGGLDGAAAIVLGEFCGCADDVSTALAERPPTGADPARSPRRPLRRKFDERQAMTEIFATRADSSCAAKRCFAEQGRLDIPVAYQLPIGHGPHFAPLPLGATYELTTDGRFTCIDWSWLRA